MWSLMEVMGYVGLEHALEVPTPGDQDVVEAPEPGRARRPAEHLELMTEDEDLEVPDDVISVTLAADDEETDEGAGDKVDERPHRPIVPGATSTNRGFRPPRELIRGGEVLRDVEAAVVGCRPLCPDAPGLDR
jgi:hypothetical protein